MNTPMPKSTDASTGTASTSSKNLLERLPAGAVLAFQALAATFTNQGHCYPSNWWLTVGLVTILSVACIFCSFTDSIEHKGKVYYGVAMPRRLNIFNMHKREEEAEFRDLKPKLKKLGLKIDDWVHALLSLVVFLTIAGSDVGLQKCFFREANADTQQLLKNLPLGMAVMSTFLFNIFPTTRKGIRFDNSNALGQKNNKVVADEETGGTPRSSQSQQDKKEVDEAAGAAGETKQAADRAAMSSANLMQLLPTGPVLAFQTLAASFTNQGKCLHSNWWLTVGLVTFLGATCIFSCFTDCIPDKDGKVRNGVALHGRLHIIGMSIKEQRDRFDRTELKKRRLKTVDCIHAFFSAVVFLTIAGSDVGLQDCFFPNAKDNAKQLLKNLPLGMAVMSSFVFMVFPTTRNSMCFDDSDNTPKKQDESGNKQEKPAAT